MFFLKVTLCHTSKLLSSQVQDWFTVTISKTRIFQTHFSSFGEEAWSETTPDSAVTTFKWSFTCSLTHSSLKGFPLEFIFLVKRWVVVLIKLLQYWIQVLNSLLSIWKRNVDSISWLNWRASSWHCLLFVFSSPTKVFFHPWFCFASYLWENFCFGHLWEDHRSNSSRHWLLSVALGTHTSIVPHSSIGYLYLNCCGLEFFQFDHSSIFVAVFCIIFSLSCSCCILKIGRQHDNDCHNNIPALLQKTETEIIISCSMSSSCKILAHEKKDQYTTIQALLQKTHSDNHQLQNPSMRRRIGTTS